MVPTQFHNNYPHLQQQQQNCLPHHSQVQYTAYDHTQESTSMTGEVLTLWVGNLSEHVTEQDLKEFFKNSPILRIKLCVNNPETRPCAFVDVADSVALDRVLRLSGERLHGVRLKIEYDPSRLRKAKSKMALRINTVAARPESNNYETDIGIPKTAGLVENAHKSNSWPNTKLKTNFGNEKNPELLNFAPAHSAPPKAAPWTDKRFDAYPLTNNLNSRIFDQGVSDTAATPVITSNEECLTSTSSASPVSEADTTPTTWNSPPIKYNTRFSSGANWDKLPSNNPLPGVGWDDRKRTQTSNPHSPAQSALSGNTHNPSFLNISASKWGEFHPSAKKDHYNTVWNKTPSSPLNPRVQANWQFSEQNNYPPSHESSEFQGTNHQNHSKSQRFASKKLLPQINTSPSYLSQTGLHDRAAPMSAPIRNSFQAPHFNNVNNNISGPMTCSVHEDNKKPFSRSLSFDKLEDWNEPTYPAHQSDVRSFESRRHFGNEIGFDNAVKPLWGSGPVSSARNTIGTSQLHSWKTNLSSPWALTESELRSPLIQKVPFSPFDTLKETEAHAVTISPIEDTRIDRFSQANLTQTLPPNNMWKSELSINTIDNSVVYSNAPPCNDFDEPSLTRKETAWEANIQWTVNNAMSSPAMTEKPPSEFNNYNHWESSVQHTTLGSGNNESNSSMWNTSTIHKSSSNSSLGSINSDRWGPAGCVNNNKVPHPMKAPKKAFNNWNEKSTTENSLGDLTFALDSLSHSGAPRRQASNSNLSNWGNQADTHGHSEVGGMVGWAANDGLW